MFRGAGIGRKARSRRSSDRGCYPSSEEFYPLGLRPACRLPEPARAYDRAEAPGLPAIGFCVACPDTPAFRRRVMFL